MINATMCFLKSGGSTLFLYRNKGEGDIHNGWYVPPGGRTERGERGIDCVIREFKEETGLRLLDPKLRVMATFYNEGRIMGGKENPEDWFVEVYEATRFTGKLREEHPNAKPLWLHDINRKGIRIYPGDRKIIELLKEEGTFEVIVQYSGERLVRFDYRKV